MNTTQASCLTARINDLEDQLATARRELNKIITECNRAGHKWGEVKYTPKHQPAYTIPGDPIGTMGVDWRGPTHVDAKTIRKWSRTCSECGLTQETTKTKPTPSQGATPGTVAIVEQPDFV